MFIVARLMIDHQKNSLIDLFITEGTTLQMGKIKDKKSPLQVRKAITNRSGPRPRMTSFLPLSTLVTRPRMFAFGIRSSASGVLFLFIP